MTNKENEILHYLINNCNDNGEISISDKDLADNCDTTTTTIRTFKINGQKENLFKYENRVYTIPKETRIDYSYLVDNITKSKGLKYNTTEKNVLGYITDRYNTIQDNEGYTYSTLDYIGKECGISNKQKLLKIINKLVADGLIEMIKGDFSKKQASRFKVLFPTKQIETQTINQSEKSTTFSQCEKITINNYINELELKELKELVINQSKQISDLKDSMINLHKKFSVVEKIADTLLSYIDEVEHDLDNVYMLNNIQRPKPQCKCSIFDIRKILDENKQ